VELSYTLVNVKTDEPAILYEMAEGNAPGITHRWDLSARYSFHRNMDFSLYYTGELEEDFNKPLHRGSAEMKAYF
jgi:hypothetical protein